MVVYKRVLYFAIRHKFVDNPNARKLQSRPIPVLGGVVVFWGLLVSLCVMCFLGLDISDFLKMLVAMIAMICLGITDDYKGLSPLFRFIVEIIVVLFIVWVSDYSIENFYGVWGICSIRPLYAILLSVLAAVGIINAINLIDGVDGYSSGFCTMASILFAIMFYKQGNEIMTFVAVASVGALIPFFLHNVFGFKSKMFIGDGGTLLMGVIMAIFVMNIFTNNNLGSIKMMLKGVGLVPFTLAVLSIPVFDTLRVMTMRIVRGRSPFKPDKTHLHHLFIDLGFSHVGTTFGLLTLDFLIVVAWYVAYKCGLSANVQLYIVLVFGFLVTFLLYPIVKLIQKKSPRLTRFLLLLGQMSHLERKGIWSWMRRVLDKGYDENIR